jgi:hypothetical protein
VAGYTTFAPPPSAGRKIRFLVLVENGLAVRANVKVITDIIDPAVQSVFISIILTKYDMTPPNDKIPHFWCVTYRVAT